MVRTSTQLELDEYPAGNWISIGHPAVAELSAALGFDFILIDTEHTSMSLETVEDLTRAVDAADGVTETIVRVPENDPSKIKRTLDIGVSGIMVPMIETADEARTIAQACQYPPDGFRGIAGGRAAKYGLDFHDYVENANGSILTIAQIETQCGLKNIEEIARVDGIDALFVGPADLSGNLNVFAEWDSETLNDAINDVIDAGSEANMPIGTLATRNEDIETRVQQGFDFLIVGKDTSYLAAGSKHAKDIYEESVNQHSKDTIKRHHED